VTRSNPEDVLLRNVIELCRRVGLRTAHFRPALSKSGRWVTAVQGDGKGFPDLVIVGAGGVLYRELKADGKYPAPEQRAWIAALTAAGRDAGVWKPRDWPDRIQAELNAIRRPVEVCRG
jgi:hypothetical protein